MLDQPGVLFGDVLEAYMANDPGLIVRLFKLWTATPARPIKVRWNYPVVWRVPGIGDLRILGVVTVASHPDALGFNDWIPQDAESYERLAMVVGRPSDHGGADEARPRREALGLDRRASR